MGTLTDQVAVVTGGSRGIGKAIAGKLASMGARVAILSRGEAGGVAAEEINREFAGSAQAFVADVADGESVQAAAKDLPITKAIGTYTVDGPGKKKC